MFFSSSSRTPLVGRHESLDSHILARSGRRPCCPLVPLRALMSDHGSPPISRGFLSLFLVSFSVRRGLPPRCTLYATLLGWGPVKSHRTPVLATGRFLLAGAGPYRRLGKSRLVSRITYVRERSRK
jgi:hypothetical protein